MSNPLRALQRFVILISKTTGRDKVSSKLLKYLIYFLDLPNNLVFHEIPGWSIEESSIRCPNEISFNFYVINKKSKKFY